jgi:hypothetical protein
MAFQVSEEPVDRSWEEAMKVLNATRRQPVPAERFDWLYRRNPDGKAVLWAARDNNSNTMLGFTVALPRRAMVEGSHQLVWNCADFSIHKQCRTLGIALKLRRLAKEGVDLGRVNILYAHPNDGMAVIHLKVGHFPIGHMIRYAKALRTAGYLSHKFRSNALGGLVGRVADPILRFAGRESRHRATMATTLISPAAFDDRFDDLNWRYVQNPLYQTEMLIAEKGLRLAGYLLFVVQDGVANIKDLFPPCEPVVARDLIVALVRESRRRRLSSISVGLLEGNPLVPILNEFGFHERPDTSTMYSYVSPESPLHEAVKNPSSWFITVGDRDV